MSEMDLKENQIQDLNERAMRAQQKATEAAQEADEVESELLALITIGAPKPEYLKEINGWTEPRQRW